MQGRRYSDRVFLWINMVLFGLWVPSLVLADELEDSLKRADEMYHTYDLAPGRLEEAIRLYEQALVMRPKDYHILWKLSDMYHNYALTLGDNQKKRQLLLWIKGLEYDRRALAVNPEGKEAHFYLMANLGAYAQARGMWSLLRNFRDIKKAMDRAMELDPHYPQALVARAQFVDALPGLFGSREEEVQELFQRAIESNPRFVAATYFHAKFDAKHKRYKKALEKLDKVFQCQDPWNHGHFVKIICPRAESLREEILTKMNKRR